jgi:hypothetical protein
MSDSISQNDKGGEIIARVPLQTSIYQYIDLDKYRIKNLTTITCKANGFLFLTAV